MRPRLPTLVTLVAALAGLVFAGWSTADFVAHLDRQVHAIHCSFVPGLAAAEIGASGCKVALMSPWSSVFRRELWGGVPVTLPGMAVFAYLLWRSLDAWLGRRELDRSLAGFQVAAWLLPVLTSVFFGWIALTELGEACKLCVGIYAASSVGFAGALWGLQQAGAAALRDGAPVDGQPPTDGADLDAPAAPPPGSHALRFAEGVLFVAVPLALYVALAPDFSGYVGTCGELASAPEAAITVPLGGTPGATAALEVLDPLCPSCAGMEKRLAASGFDAELDRRGVLFPLDPACNWMVSTAIHPGACTVSEAVLCAGDDASAVLGWAFEHGEAIRAAEAAEAGAAARLVTQRFPALAGCVGSAAARAKLNRSLRWAVKNKLAVLTPQLYVDGRKLCDDDTDLGLDWSLAQLLARARTASEVTK